MIIALALAVQSLPPGFWHNDPVMWPGWEYLGRTTTGADWYIHNETTRQVARGAESWVRIDYTHDRTQRARTQRGLVTIFCLERRFYWRSLDSLAANGAPVGEQGASSLEQDIPPDTMMENIWRRLCTPPAPSATPSR